MSSWRPVTAQSHGIAFVLAPVAVNFVLSEAKGELSEGGIPRQTLPIPAVPVIRAGVNGHRPH
jgi:hypothetical protein